MTIALVVAVLVCGTTRSRSGEPKESKGSEGKRGGKEEGRKQERKRGRKKRGIEE